MKILLFFSLFFSSFTFTFPDLNTLDKSKPIWKDVKITFVHQYLLDVGFGRVNNYLCLFKNSDYKNYSNLENGVGYKAILDSKACEYIDVARPWTVVSKQQSTDSNLDMEMVLLGQNADTRMKLTMEEETSDANPYGKLTLNYDTVTKPNSEPLYKATFKSSKHSDNQVKFEAAYFLDSAVLDNLINVGRQKSFYSTKIIHTLNSGGHGSARHLYYNLDLTVLGQDYYSYYLAIFYPQFFPPGYTKNYPDGNPITITTVNFAYNDNVVKYEIMNGYSGQKNGVWLNSGPSGGGTFQRSSPGTELCVSRTGSWSYMSTTGYGIYNSSGDRLGNNPDGDNNANTGLSVNYDLQAINNITTNNSNFDGTVKIVSGSQIQVTSQCKKMADGSLYGNTVCPGTGGEQNTIVLINGEYYENFPLFDIPEGSILTDANGNEYYIRQLGQQKVYPVKTANDLDCASLTIQNSLDTPEHTFFDYSVINTPKSGAILVNKLSSNPSLDLYAQGNFFSLNGDQDGDGILNFLDAFPTDALKSLDTDYDGIDDSIDNSNDSFQQDWSNHKYLDKSTYSNYYK
tara:strand:+ start:361 stop:2070 length:1710 start_codon:yes stop_codon:yes gene_type:complete